jgi:hypothetical protein
MHVKSARTVAKSRRRVAYGCALHCCLAAMRSAREAEQFLNGLEPPLGPTGHVPVPLNPNLEVPLTTATITDSPREARDTSGRRA